MKTEYGESPKSFGQIRGRARHWRRRHFFTAVHRFAQTKTENAVDERWEKIYCAPRSKRKVKTDRGGRRKARNELVEAPSSDMRNRT